MAEDPPPALAALRAVLDPRRAALARAQIPPAWDALPDGTVIVAPLLEGSIAITARMLRRGTWRASLDPPSDHGAERAGVELAAAAARQLAHDLQTPLATAAARVELATSGATAEASDALSYLHDLSALQAARAQRFPRTCDELHDDAEGLRRVDAALAREFSRHGARWRFDASGEPEEPLGGAALQSALMILGENALDAVKRGGQTVRASLGHRGDHIELRVVDDGPGLDLAAAELLLAAPRPHGTRASLGLWTLRVIATALRGALAFSPVTPHGLDARVALSSRPLRPSSRG